jgi:hypothetical protein
MNLREAAREIEAIARDLRSTAHKLDAEAAWAERAGIKAGEPDPAAVPSWVADAAPGELTELFGR